jgi:hypothetical protein
VKTKKGQEICLPPYIEATQIKGEDAISNKKDHNKDVCQWRSKIA